MNFDLYLNSRERTKLRGASCLTLVGLSAYIPCISHLGLKCHLWIQETELSPQLALNNGKYNQSLTFGDHSAHCYVGSNPVDFSCPFTNG